MLSGGELLHASHVIIAIGINSFRKFPDFITSLPRHLYSHSSELWDLTRFRGQRIMVLGGGASATDLAALLCDIGAKVSLVARTKKLAWLSRAQPRALLRRFLSPHTGLGFGWKHAAYMAFPEMYRHLPAAMRIRLTNTTLGPSGAFHTRDRVERNVCSILGHTVQSAAVVDDQIIVVLRDCDGNLRTEPADHLICATGFSIDISKIDFLSDQLRNEIRCVGRAPELSSTFESSVSGLYFSGAMASYSFGPIMRFVVGTGFSAPRIAHRIIRDLSEDGSRLPNSRLPSVEHAPNTDAISQ